MTDAIDLARARRTRAADEARDNRLWTVEDALKDLLDSIRELPEDEQPNELIAVARKTTEGEDGFKTWERHAGVTTTSAVALLERAKFELLFRAEMEAAG